MAAGELRRAAAGRGGGARGKCRGEGKGGGRRFRVQALEAGSAAGGRRGGSLIGSMWLSDTLGCWAPQRISKVGVETKGDGVIPRRREVCFPKQFTFSVEYTF